MYPESLIAALVEFCEKKGIYLIMDDIYHKLVFDGKTLIPAYRYTQKDIESTKVICINGISKLYGMTGFRIGWVVASKALTDVMINVQAQTTSCTSVLLQAERDFLVECLGRQIPVGEVEVREPVVIEPVVALERLRFPLCGVLISSMLFIASPALIYVRRCRSPWARWDRAPT